MEKEPLISVIVPVYGVEQYLDRCVESIVNQTYQNLEIILVDDGSPDNCPAMCDVWAEKDSRIKVIHKENGGLSDARNAGMELATGELMGFVDSDDWIASEMYQLLYENMVETGSDISCCGVEMVWEDGTPSRMLTKTGCCVLNREEAMEAIIEESWMKQPVWYKLYKNELIRDILFPVGKYHEDVFWSYKAVGRAKKVSVFDAPCYYYTQRSGSIMGSGYSLKRLDGLEAKQQRLHTVEQNYPKLVNLAKQDLWFSAMYGMQMSLRYLTPEDQKWVHTYIAKMCKAIMPVNGSGLAIKQMMWLQMSKVSFERTCRLRNLLGIGT